jgi:hypothetical protein
LIGSLAMRISGLKKAESRSGVLCKGVIVMLLYRHLVTTKVFGFLVLTSFTRFGYLINSSFEVQLTR